MCSRRVWKTAAVCSAEYAGMYGGQLSPHACCPLLSIRTRMVSVSRWSAYDVFHTKARGIFTQ